MASFPYANASAGMLEFTNQMYVNPADYKRFVVAAQKKVGILKATWMPAVKRFNAFAFALFMGSRYGKIYHAPENIRLGAWEHRH